MQVGMIGLGRMGSNMAQRLVFQDHEVIAFDQDQAAMNSVSDHAISTSHSLGNLVEKLVSPRIIFLMLPSGNPTEAVINTLHNLLSPGDTIVDGGNANYKDSIRRYNYLAENDVNFLDVGISGGIWGLTEGYSLMVGGDKITFEQVEPLFKALAPSSTTGYKYIGKTGSGHFVKMIHNAVEYGMMQAYAEGFELLEAKSEFELDLQGIAETWRFGSVVRSWLLDLTSNALIEDPNLQEIASYVEDSGEGRWAVQESVDLAIPAPILTLSLFERFRSRQSNPFGHRLLAALRKQFGGHSVRRRE
ncbi:MAG: decarboxylating 6-phosphogluconate dehydrogenase [Chloroflexota bacterium]|nr:decarboxylating 6-phosphogluconate dehydrogenase [Chloroflexota bacterium]